MSNHCNCAISSELFGNLDPAIVLCSSVLEGLPSVVKSKVALHGFVHLSDLVCEKSVKGFIM